MTREEMIDELIENDIETLRSRDIREILLNGITGYKDLTNDQIEEMYNNLTE